MLDTALELIRDYLIEHGMNAPYILDSKTISIFDKNQFVTTAVISLRGSSVGIRTARGTSTVDLYEPDSFDKILEALEGPHGRTRIIRETLRYLWS